MQAERLIQQEEQIRAQLSEAKSSLATLKLGVSEAVSASIGPWFLDRLYKTVDNLTVYSNLSYELIRKLSRHQLDVALCSGFQPEGANWYRREVWREEFLIVCSKSLGEIQSVEELKELSLHVPFICYNNDYLDQYRAQRLLSTMNIEPERRLAVSSSYELTGLIALKNGFAIVPPTNIWCGREFFSSVSISRLPLVVRTHRGMWVVGSALDRTEATDLVFLEAQVQMKHFMADVLSKSCPGLQHYIEVQ